jgi:hypothetical protein
VDASSNKLSHLIDNHIKEALADLIIDNVSSLKMKSIFLRYKIH